MAPSKLIRAQGGVPTSQSGSPTKKWPEFAKKHPKSSLKYQVPLCQGTRQVLHKYIGNQSLCFHYMALSKAFRTQEAIPTSKSGSTNHKNSLNWLKTSKITKKYHVLLSQGTWPMLYWHPTTLFALNGPD